jgi:ActR/RegA family two-component response regulator
MDPDSAIRIWIAEDDEELLEILGNALGHRQREIQLFRNGQAVFQAVEGSSFDILITDLVMPGADGLQILNEAKRHHPESVVIIVTGYASLDTAIQAIRGGAYDYIRKPFKLDELDVVVNNACEKILLMRENRRLVQNLQETMEEVKRLRGTLDDHLSNISGLSRMISNHKNSEMEFALNQINPSPPDYDLKKEESQGKVLDTLERLIQFRKNGLISEDEFFSLKKILLKKLDDSKVLPRQ